MTTLRSTSPLAFAEPLPTDLAAAVATRRRPEVIVCAAVFAVLVAWLLLFPYTGDGDSVLHYLNARDTAVRPADGLHSWARPGYKFLLAVVAPHGITAARVFMAAVATAVCWQTIRLAGDLDLPRPYLAGLMVLWQPAAFAVAADTMTEFPMALGLVVAVRLWMAGWLTASCLVVGFLPSVRPEGFFFGVLWGLMVAVGPAPKSWRARAQLLPALAAGLAAWVVACRVFTGDWLYIVHVWNWPAAGYDAYGRGSVFHYAVNFPLYAGLPLTVLFLFGIAPSWRDRRTRLVWAAWGTVIGVHSVLYTHGWFASCGLIRILACTAPFTAVVCLYGWARLADWSADSGHDAARRRRVGIGFGVVATAWTLGTYCTVSEHFDCFPLMRCTAYVRDHQLLGPDTWFFTGNQIATADLDLPPKRPHTMPTPCDPKKIQASLAALPIGSIGIWDNRQAPVWHGQTIEGLAAHGFTVLYDTNTSMPRHLLRYVVLRKDGPFPDPP